MVKLQVDGKEIEANQETSLLQACLDNDIYIPNLCFLKDMKSPPASCRLCFVDIEGEAKPVASCTVTVKEAMVVRTDTPPVRRLQRAAFRLLLSVHDVDCKNCPANKKCELQHMAKFLKVGLKSKGLERILKEPDIDQEHPILDYYPNRCILCGKCVRVCRDAQGQPSLAFAKRGFDTIISSYGAKDGSTLPCTQCAACVDICPVGAIILKESASLPNQPKRED